MKVKTLILVGLVASSYNLSSQIGIVGQITNQPTNAPVEYAHIFLLRDQSRGVFSNQVGKFQFPLDSERPDDTLVISKIGYETAFLPLNQLQKDTNRILLKETIYDLGQVTVTDEESIKNIFRKAIQKIPEQYGDKSYSLKGFFQEYTITDYSYAELLEAFVNIKDSDGYGNSKTASEIRLQALRKSDDLRTDNTFEIKRNQLYQHYEQYDHVRTRSFYLPSGDLGEKFFQKFTFRKLGEYTENGDTLIKIGFENPKMIPTEEDRSFASGEVVIRKSDLGILSVKRDALRHGIYHETSYQKINGKYFPLKITTTLSNYHFPKSSHAQLNVVNLIIYEVTPSEQTDSGKLLLRKENLRESQLPYDPAFWDQNEIVQPVPAPEAMKQDIERSRSLKEQFERNATKTKRSEK